MPSTWSRRLTQAAWVLFLVANCGMAGCGSNTSTTATSTPTPSSAALNGNWLIVGTLPFQDPLNTANRSFGISMTFSVVGTQIVAGGTENVPCGSATIGGGVVLTGTIAADGTLSAQTTLSGSVPLLVLTGTAPAAGASTWTGNYTYTSTAGASSCPETFTGSFTATRIADLTGTYAPAAPIQLAPGSLGASTQSVTLSFSFTQGATLPGTTTLDPELLAGTVQIQGSSCFKSGTAAAVAGSGLLGSVLVTSFTLNDGSTMNFLGDIENTGSTRLVAQVVLISGGTCGTFSAQPFELVHQ